MDDTRLKTLTAHLLTRQMPDGGWNCRDRGGASHASFHTTIAVLVALRDYEQLWPRLSRAMRAAQEGGREFLLAHRLFRSHRTGEVVSGFDTLRFPAALAL